MNQTNCLDFLCVFFAAWRLCVSFDCFSAEDLTQSRRAANEKKKSNGGQLAIKLDELNKLLGFFASLLRLSGFA
jgi:hypothetical protein